MSRLVDELKREHQDLVQALEEIRDSGITSEEAQAKLLQVKNALLAHLKKEDEQLYPTLHKEAENSRELARTIDMFASDMSNITAFAMEFFEKYASGGEGIGFAGDFGKLYATLGARVRKEEAHLYEEYNKIAG